MNSVPIPHGATSLRLERKSSGVSPGLDTIHGRKAPEAQASKARRDISLNPKYSIRDTHPSTAMSEFHLVPTRLRKIITAFKSEHTEPQPPSTPSQHESEPGQPQDQTAKDDSLFWDQYVKEAELYDGELVKGLGGDLDSLLIFAGLFSSVNTAFIIESYQDLKPDPAESGGTNGLLRTLIHTLDNSTTAATSPADFVPSQRVVFVNALFFASLFCSLFSAFGAVLAKQWLNEYERTGDNRVPHARARQRHAKLLGMQRYRCEMVLQALGTVLQISLVLFFVALTNWLWGVNHAIAILAIVALGAIFGFYFITTTISIIDPASPFSTRFSALLRKLWSSKSTRQLATTTRMDRMDGECIAWVRDNATTFESVAGMARSAADLPDDIRTGVGLSHANVGTSLLRSIISSNALPLGLTNGTLFSTITTIQYAMTSWKDVPILLACDVIAQLHEMLRLAVPRDPMMSESITFILYHIELDVPDDLVTRIQLPTIATLADLVQMPSLTIDGRRAGLTLLWKYHLRELYVGDSTSLTERVEGKLEESWQWKVAGALASTAMVDYRVDSDPERLEFRVAWAAIFGADEMVSRKLLYGEEASTSPRWNQFFTSAEFQVYLQDQIPRYPTRSDIILRRVVMDLLVSQASCTMPKSLSHCWSWDKDNNERGWLGIAFHVGHRFRPASIAPLYWWYHFHVNHESLDFTMPAAYTSKRYLRLAIFEFLAEQLGSDRWIPERHVPWTVAAIQAYVAQVNTMDPSMQGHYDQSDTRPLEEMSKLLQSIRTKSIHYQGRESICQELWDCFKLVVRVLHPGDGVVKFRTRGLRSEGDTGDDLENYHPRFYSSDDLEKCPFLSDSAGGEECVVDWDEVEAVKIRGSDPYGLPPVTGDNFIGFDWYGE